MTWADKAIEFFREVQRLFDGLFTAAVSIILNAVTHIAPIAAPAPAAYSIYKAMAGPHISAPAAVAITTGVAIELIGMFQAKTALRTRNWNASKLKSEPEAPFILAVTMAGIYFSVGLILTLTIEVLPEVAVIIFPAFVIFAASVYVSAAIATDLDHWEAEADERKREQKRKRGVAAERKQLEAEVARLAKKRQRLESEIATMETKTSAAVPTKNGQNAGTGSQLPATGTPTKDAARQYMTEQFRQGNEPSGTEVGNAIGKSGRLGRNLKAELWPEIIAGNGRQNGSH